MKWLIESADWFDPDPSDPDPCSAVAQRENLRWRTTGWLPSRLQLRRERGEISFEPPTSRGRERTQASSHGWPRSIFLRPPVFPGAAPEAAALQRLIPL